MSVLERVREREEAELGSSASAPSLPLLSGSASVLSGGLSNASGWLRSRR